MVSLCRANPLLNWPFAYGGLAFIQSINRRTQPCVGKRMGRFDDDEDAVVVAVNEPVKWHGSLGCRSPAGLRDGEIPCKRFLLLSCLSVLGQVQGLTAASSM